MNASSTKFDELITLVYTSMATRPMTEKDLLDILEVSRRNNTADEITGLLLYHNGNFMQVLEGPRANVEHTYQRIARDKRHHYVVTVLKQPITDRAFGAWKMSFVNLSNPTVADDPAYSRYLLDTLGDPGLYRHNSIALSFIETFRFLNQL
ncbi:MAG: BLUF domain-containing protein [Anaerolineae bacterium]